VALQARVSLQHEIVKGTGRGVAYTGQFRANSPKRRTFLLKYRNAQMPLQNYRMLSAAHVGLLFICTLGLAACETDGTGPTAGDAPKAAAVSPRPDAAPKPQAVNPEPVHDAEPMTRSRAARECWMRTEKANAHEDLDKRADLVNKCIDDKMKAAGMTAPKT
jgi:hypothetical protein